MPTPALSREECFKAVQAVDEAVKKGYVVNGRPSAVRHAAGALGMNVKAIEHRIQSAQHRYGDGLHLQFNRQKLRVAESSKRIMRLEQAETPEPKLPDFPDDDIAESEIIDLMCRRYEKRAEHKASKKWFRIEMLDDYAEKLGFMPQRDGASIMTVFLPATSRHYSFEHPEDGIAFLDAVGAA